MAAVGLEQGGLKHGWSAPRGVRLHYVEAGAGPLVLLLHGFPDFWYVWRYQLRPLANAGFHVVAPDLRGYNLSDKPSAVREYALPVVADEIAALLAAFGADQASLVGHDFGGAIAWWLASQWPDRIARLSVLNTPHPVRFLRGWLTPAQAARSSYMLLFQLPGIPEITLRARDFAVLRWLLRSRPGRAASLSQADMQQYLHAWQQPGALRAMLNYYRALKYLGPVQTRRTFRPVRQPVLSIWGAADRFARPELADPGQRLAPNARVHWLAGVGHWPHVDRHDTVNALLIAFLRAASTSPGGPA